MSVLTSRVLRQLDIDDDLSLDEDWALASASSTSSYVDMESDATARLSGFEPLDASLGLTAVSDSASGSHHHSGVYSGNHASDWALQQEDEEGDLLHHQRAFAHDGIRSTLLSDVKPSSVTAAASHHAYAVPSEYVGPSSMDMDDSFGHELFKPPMKASSPAVSLEGSTVGAMPVSEHRVQDDHVSCPLPEEEDLAFTLSSLVAEHSVLSAPLPDQVIPGLTGHDEDQDQSSVSSVTVAHSDTSEPPARRTRAHTQPRPSASNTNATPSKPVAARRTSAKSSSTAPASSRASAKRRSPGAVAAAQQQQVSSPDHGENSRDPNHNARMAKLNREKKKAYIAELESKVTDLEEDLGERDQRLAHLEEQLAAERQQVQQLRLALQSAPQLAALLQTIQGSHTLNLGEPTSKRSKTAAAVLPIQINLHLAQ